ncbi:MAG TPA: hypothetical protein VLG50_04705 [Candidatus Saccharimonadales bacterium]|nr:hypothetical protein [Candidatus Saccharimonadales bacterium]
MNMNKNTFKFFALFSLVAFSSASSYSMLRRSMPQISTLPFIALRHCTTGSSTAQATETPKVEFKYSDTRMHPDDMAALKAETKYHGFDWIGVWSACILAGLVTMTSTRNNVDSLRIHQNQIIMKLNSIESKLNKINESSK